MKEEVKGTGLLNINWNIVLLYSVELYAAIIILSSNLNTLIKNPKGIAILFILAMNTLLIYKEIKNEEGIKKR